MGGGGGRDSSAWKPSSFAAHFRRIVELTCSKDGCCSSAASSTGSIRDSLGFLLIVPPTGESASNAESLASLVAADDPMLVLLKKDSDLEMFDVSSRPMILASSTRSLV